LRAAGADLSHASSTPQQLAPSQLLASAFIRFLQCPAALPCALACVQAYLRGDVANGPARRAALRSVLGTAAVAGVTREAEALAVVARHLPALHRPPHVCQTASAADRLTCVKRRPLHGNEETLLLAAADMVSHPAAYRHVLQHAASLAACAVCKTRAQMPDTAMSAVQLAAQQLLAALDHAGVSSMRPAASATPTSTRRADGSSTSSTWQGRQGSRRLRPRPRASSSAPQTRTSWPLGARCLPLP
jgi:hypothetical protein